MCGTLARRMPQVPSKSKKKSYFCCRCYCLVAKSCLILCSPMARSSLGFSTHGIAQARILQWVTVSFSRWSSGPRNRTPAGGSFIPEPRGKFKLWASNPPLAVHPFDHRVVIEQQNMIPSPPPSPSPLRVGRVPNSEPGLITDSFENQTAGNKTWLQFFL